MNREVMFSSKRQDWATPDDVFKKLDDEFHFTLDAASSHENAKCAKHYTIVEDGLKQDWTGERVFINPPFGREIGKWVRKASEESCKPNTLVVMLIPARTDTSYWHDYIFARRSSGERAEVRFLRGRITFKGGTATAPFPSAVVVFR